MICLSLCASASAIFFVFNYVVWGEILAFLFLILAISWSLFYIKAIKKVALIKHECKNQLTLKITRKSCCSEQYSLMIENAYLFCQGDIMLLNTLKNSNEIDLENSKKCSY